jgi:hypothetical protein
MIVTSVSEINKTHVNLLIEGRRWDCIANAVLPQFFTLVSNDATWFDGVEKSADRLLLRLATEVEGDKP